MEQSNQEKDLKVIFPLLSGKCLYVYLWICEWYMGQEEKVKHLSLSGWTEIGCHQDTSHFVKGLCPTNDCIDNSNLEENILLPCEVSINSTGVSPNQKAL